MSQGAAISLAPGFSQGVSMSLNGPSLGGGVGICTGGPSIGGYMGSGSAGTSFGDPFFHQVPPGASISQSTHHPQYSGVPGLQGLGGQFGQTQVSAAGLTGGGGHGAQYGSAHFNAAGSAGGSGQGAQFGGAQFGASGLSGGAFPGGSGGPPPGSSGGAGPSFSAPAGSVPPASAAASAPGGGFPPDAQAILLQLSQQMAALSAQVQAQQRQHRDPGKSLERFVCPPPVVKLVDTKTGKCLDGLSATSYLHPDNPACASWEDFTGLTDQEDLNRRRLRIVSPSGVYNTVFRKDGTVHTMGGPPVLPETILLSENKHIRLSTCTPKAPGPKAGGFTYYEWKRYAELRVAELRQHASMRYTEWFVANEKASPLPEYAKWMCLTWHMIIVTYMALNQIFPVLLDRYKMPFDKVLEMCLNWLKTVWSSVNLNLKSTADKLGPFLQKLPDRIFLAENLGLEAPEQLRPDLAQIAFDIMEPFCALDGAYPQGHYKYDPYGRWVTSSTILRPFPSGGGTLPITGASAAYVKPNGVNKDVCSLCRLPTEPGVHGYSRKLGHMCWEPISVPCPHCNFLHCVSGPRALPCGNHEPPHHAQQCRASYAVRYCKGEFPGVPPPEGCEYVPVPYEWGRGRERGRDSTDRGGGHGGGHNPAQDGPGAPPAAGAAGGPQQA